MWISVVPGQGTKHGCCSSCSLSFRSRSPHLSSSRASEGFGLSGQSDQCCTHVRFLSLVPSPHSAPCTKAHAALIKCGQAVASWAEELIIVTPLTEWLTSGSETCCRIYDQLCDLITQLSFLLSQQKEKRNVSYNIKYLNIRKCQKCF